MSLQACSPAAKKPTWEFYFRLLTDFKEKHGHTQVPIQYGEHGLAVWVYRQRHLAAKPCLTAVSRLVRLEALGVFDPKQLEWDRKNAKWVKSFLECVKMREAHGDQIRDISTGHWLAAQRSKHRRGLLEDRCTCLLAEIGFAWDQESKEPDWDDMFQRLVEYQRRFRTSNVSLDYLYAEDPELAFWVHDLMYYPQVLTASQMKQLESINFRFDNPQPSVVKKKSSGIALATAAVTGKKAASSTKESGVVEDNPKLKSRRPSLPTEKNCTKTTISPSSTGSSRRRSVSIPERYRDDPEEKKPVNTCASTYNARVPLPQPEKNKAPAIFYSAGGDRIAFDRVTNHDGQYDGGPVTC
jgi:Helicase associated domain